MNVTVAYATEVSFHRIGHGEYNVIDDAASVGRRYPLVIGHVSVIRGFGHYVGDRATSHKGVKAVIRLSGGGDMTQVTESLRTGLRSGRDDRR